MDNFKDMSVKINTVTKQLPKYSRTTEEIIPFLDAWLEGQDERFIRKVKKYLRELQSTNAILSWTRLKFLKNVI
jgi:hypothetical protein